MSKKALLIGFNYPRSTCPLAGCWNDIVNIKAFLRSKGYQEKNITLITDAPPEKDIARGVDKETQDKLVTVTQPIGAPKIAISQNDLMHLIVDFIETLQPNDQVFFHFSGHGGQLPDRNGDESDALDECIYAPDLSPVIDDDLRLALVDSLPAGARLVAIMDCCHSGTGMDLPFVKKRFGVSTENYQATTNDVWCISACRDQQTAADTSFDRIPQGALTHAFLKAVSQHNPNWTSLLDKIISDTKNFPQVAQLSCGKRQGFTDKVLI